MTKSLLSILLTPQKARITGPGAISKPVKVLYNSPTSQLDTVQKLRALIQIMNTKKTQPSNVTLNLPHMSKFPSQK